MHNAPCIAFMHDFQINSVSRRVNHESLNFLTIGSNLVLLRFRFLILFIILINSFSLLLPFLIFLEINDGSGESHPGPIRLNRFFPVIDIVRVPFHLVNVLLPSCADFRCVGQLSFEAFKDGHNALKVADGTVRLVFGRTPATGTLLSYRFVHF